MIPGQSQQFFEAAAAQAADSGYEITRSLRFNDDDGAKLTRTPSSAGNQKKWTWSGWVKRSSLGVKQHLFAIHTADNDSGYFRLAFQTDSTIFVGLWSKSILTTDAVFRDFSAWLHVVLVLDTANSTAADRIILYVNGVRQSVTGSADDDTAYAINSAGLHNIGSQTSTSQYFDGYLADVHFIDGQALAASDFGEYDDNNVWQPKAYTGSYGTNGFHLDFSDSSSSAALGTDSSGNSNDWTVHNISPIRAGNGTYGATISNSTLNYDPSVIFNGNPSSAYSDRPINNSTVTFTGIPQASTSVRIYLTSLESGTMTTNGSYAVSPGSQFPNAYIEPTNVTYPFTLTSITVTGGNSGDGYGIGAIEVDGVELVNQSGPETDVLFDVPTNGDSSDDTGAGGEVNGNYATFNPLLANSEFTYANGNLETSFDAGDNNITVSTIAPKSGKWYAEIVFTASGVANNFYGEVAVADASKIGQGFNSSTSTRYREGSADIYGAGTATGTKSDFAVDDVMGVAVDADNDTVYFYKNNTLEGTVTGLGFDGYAIGVAGNSGTGRTFTAVVNYGQRSWVYSAPSGYKALCTTNLPDPTIADGSTAFDAKLWTGDGTSSRAITDYNFSPDFVWIKIRNDAYGHAIFDSVRGANKRLDSVNTNAEQSITDGLLSFDSNGFTIGNRNTVGENNKTYVGWAWDAGTSNTSISAGSLNSSVYNTSRIWSSGIANPSNDFDQAATNAFNGDRSNKLRTGSDSVLVTLNFSPALTVNNTVQILGEDYATADFRYTVTVDGTTTTKDVNQGQPATFNVSGSLTQITFDNNNSNGRTYLEWIKVDGKELIDSNVTPPNAPSIASTVRANPSAGFSVVSYTGTGSAATVGHGLNADMGMVITKTRESSNGWIVWHSSFSNLTDNYLQLNLTDAVGTLSNYWGSGGVTNSVIGLGTYTGNNTNGEGMIAYCFAPVAGYSAFGSYTGNGSSSDGPFVHLGFRPAFVLFRNTGSGQYWGIYDSGRDTYNATKKFLLAQDSAAEAESSASNIDFLSNGFKVRSAFGFNNGNGATIIYAAFAEHPLKTARAR